MKNVLDFFTKHTISAIAMTIISGITLITSAAGVVKVAGSMNSYRTKVPEVKTIQAALQEESTLTKTSPTPSITSKKTVLALNTGPSSNTISRNTQTNPIPSPSGSSKCIITLFGGQYDVTSLRSSHSGGDVFKCGTDQTVLYQSKHGNNLVPMQPYLVTNSNGSGSTINLSSSQSGIQIDNDTESEQEEHQSEEKTKQKQTYQESEEGE